MPKDLPSTQFVPIDLAPVNCHAVPVPKPWPSEPIPSADIVPIGVRELNNHDGYPGNHHGRDRNELCHDEKVVEPSTRLCADRVRHANGYENSNGEELVLYPPRLIGDARGREYALHEDDA